MVKFVAGVEVPVVGQPTPGGSVMVTGTTPCTMTSAAPIATEPEVDVLPELKGWFVPLKLMIDVAQKFVPVSVNVKPML